MYTGLSATATAALLENSRTLKARLLDSNNNALDIKFIDACGHGTTCNDDDISIGVACANYIEISVEKTSLIALNTEYTFQYGILLPDESYEYIPMGKFTAVELPEVCGQEMEYIMYDRMIKLSDFDYVSSLTFPSTIENVVDEIETIAGLTISTTGIDITISVDDMPTGTCRAVLGLVAGLDGKFAYTDRDGIIQFGWYTSSGVTIGADRHWNFEPADSNFTTSKIECIVDSTNKIVAGTATATQGLSFYNVLMTASRLTTIYNSLSSFAYRPMTFDCLGDPRLDPWDIIMVTDIGGTNYLVPCMNIDHSFDGGLTTMIEAVNPSYLTQNNLMDADAVMTYAERAGYNKNTLDIQETKLALELNAEATYMHINEKQDVYTGVDPTLNSYPVWDWSLSIPCDGTVLFSDDLHWEYNDACFKDHRYTLFSHVDNGETIWKQFDKVDGVWGFTIVPEDSLTVASQRINNLKIEANSLSSQMTEMATNLNTNYYTMTETSSLIEQTASEINLEIEGVASNLANDYYNKSATDAKLQMKLDYDDDGQIISLINASADEINITSDRFSLSSTGTTITPAGQITTNNIEITSGLLGNFHISNGDIYVEEEDNREFPYMRWLYYLRNGQEVAADETNINIDGFYTYNSTGYNSDMEYADELKGSTNISPSLIDTSGKILAGGTPSGVASLTLGVVGNARIEGAFTCTGTKSRLVETDNYGEILQSAYETATPMFGDMGAGSTDDTGEAIIFLDKIFMETIDDKCEYLVFLTPYANCNLWVDEIGKEYIIIKGTPNVRFAWEVKAKQKGYALNRLESFSQSNYSVEIEQASKIENLTDSSVKDTDYTTMFNTTETDYTTIFESEVA